LGLEENMALNPGILYSSLSLARTSGIHSFGGVNYDRMALGVANGVSQWGIMQPQNLGLTGLATGVSGGGAVNPVASKVIVPPNPGLVQAGLAGAGMVGPLAQSLALAISTGISTAFNASAQYVGPAAGVGVGADVSKITVANSASLVGMLMQTLTATLGPGPALSMMATGLGIGIASLLLQGTGAGAVVGVPTVPPVPMSGPTVCVVV